MQKIYFVLVCLLPLVAFAQNPKTIQVTTFPDIEYQVIDGFGASDAWRAKFVGKNWPMDKRNKIADLLFSQEVDESGNPKGRPKNDKCITSILRRKLNETDAKGVTWAERITDAMLAKAASTDSTKGTASVLKEVLERVEGKVPDHQIIDSHNVSIEYIPAKYTEAED